MISELDAELDEAPWSGVSAEALRTRLESEFVRDSDVSVESGAVLFPRSEISIVGVLLDLVSKNEEEREWNQERLGELGETDVFSRFLQEKPSSLVHCYVFDSMVGGDWGLRKFTMGRRGYIYYEPDVSLDEDFELPILAAWEPVEDGRAFEACFLTTYERHWRRACLPPRLGEFASGPAHLICEGMFRILEAEDDAWATVFDTISERLTSSVAHAVLSSCDLAGIAAANQMQPDALSALIHRLRRVKPLELTAGERRVLIAIFWTCIKG